MYMKRVFYMSMEFKFKVKKKKKKSSASKWRAYGDMLPFHPAKHPGEPALVEVDLAARALVCVGALVGVQHVQVVLGGDGQRQVLECLLC